MTMQVLVNVNRNLYSPAYIPGTNISSARKDKEWVILSCLKPAGTSGTVWASALMHEPDHNLQ